MSRTVVFLGAGASKALGLPLTNEIFPALLQRLKHDSADVAELFRGSRRATEHLNRCLEAILPGLRDFVATSGDRARWAESLPPITDVLSAIDCFLLSGNSPGAGLSPQDVDRARRLLERAIFELLVANVGPDALGMEGVPDAVSDEWRKAAALRVLPERAADPGMELRQRVVTWLKGFASSTGDQVYLISTNYDIEVEQELYNHLGYDDVFHSVDFGTCVRDPVSGTVHRRPSDAPFGVLKLHGSLNQLRCSVCDNLYVNPVGPIAYLSFLPEDRAEPGQADDPWLKMLESSGADACHCGHRPLRHLIIAPSYVRDIRDPILLEIWRSALEALRQADRWIIVGYSLPPEDVAIRSMLLRAYRGRDVGKDRPDVTVVQRERKEPEVSRYRLLLPGHRYFPDEGQVGGLSGFLMTTNMG
jgi:hypothetical protein